MRKTLFLVAVVAIAGTACSGSSGKPAAAPATSTTTTLAGSPADRALAQHISLSLADLPPGWTQKARKHDINVDAEKRQLQACLRIPMHRPVAISESPNFVAPDHVAQFASNVLVAPTRERVTQAFGWLTAGKVPPCLAQVFNTYYAHTSTTSGATYGTISARRESYPALGDRTVAFQLKIPTTIKGQSVQLYFDLIVVQHGRVEIQLVAGDAFAPPAIETSRPLLQKMLARAA